MAPLWTLPVMVIGLVIGAASWQICAAHKDTVVVLQQTEDDPFNAHADVGGAEADSVYQAIRGEMRDNYALSGDPAALAYQNWRRINAMPFPSAGHGDLLVNHYVNGTAREYGAAGGGKPLPVGSVIVQDSFTMSEFGGLLAGPLLLMEKMPAGFSSGAGSWRFMKVEPDGAVAGITGGAGAENVRHCAECHAQAPAAQDFLYLVPGSARDRVAFRR